MGVARLVSRDQGFQGDTLVRNRNCIQLSHVLKIEETPGFCALPGVDKLILLPSNQPTSPLVMQEVTIATESEA